VKLVRGGTVWISGPVELGPERRQGAVEQAGAAPLERYPGRFEEDVDILIDGKRIAEVGRGIYDRLEAEGKASAVEVIDASGKLVIPGFVNAHTHAAMTLLRSYADDFPLHTWLTEKIWPVEGRLTGEDVYWGTMLAIVEMMRAGVTTFADMYFFMDHVARAVAETGARAVIAPGMFDHMGDWRDQIAEVRQLAEKWHGGAGGRIRVMFGPHAPYSALGGFKPVAQAARELGLRVHVHLSETRKEVEDCVRAHGVTPVVLAEREGLFEAPVLAAHCVHVTLEEMEIMARRRVAVVHNPTSNMKLGSGRAPVQAMLERGVLVALGTDGTASNNNLDLLEEARLAAFLAKMEGDPSQLPAPVCLQMATINGAKALGFDDAGALRPGFLADIAILDTSGAHWAPRHDLCANLIYSGNAHDVETLLIDGEVVMEKRVLRTVDEERVLKEASKRGIALVRGASGSGAAQSGPEFLGPR